MNSIFHIANKSSLTEAIEKGFYEVPSLLSEGFIHCSTREEVLNTAKRHFNGKSDLVLIELDPSKIKAEVKYENLQGGAILYPHIYGKLNLNAIVQVNDFSSDGLNTFNFPDSSYIQKNSMIENHFLALAIKQFKVLKRQGEQAMEQINEQQFFYRANEESNSIALLVQHLSGNMISRWTDFLLSDGEKSNRNRDKEFTPHLTEKIQLEQAWENGWNTMFSTLENLSTFDLLKLITIRGEEHSVMQAILRQLAHYSQHIGQIVYLAKQMKCNDWKTLSIAKGKSEEYKP